jgi:hypothetical protein
MEAVVAAPDAASRRPTGVDLLAGILLAGTVILHVVAMIPTYSGGSVNGSLVSQPDQAALYSVLAAGWALALVVGLTGPVRIPIAAGLAVGLAATEMGFRLTDIGSVIRYGSSQAGPGLWIMTSAWAVGAAGAAAAVVAARSRRSVAQVVPAKEEPDVGPVSWWPEPDRGLDAESGRPLDEPATQPSATSPVATQPFATSPVATQPLATGQLAGAPRDGDTMAFHALAAADAEDRLAWTILVTLLALVVAGAFLPSWDHYVVYSATTRRALTFNLGNAFSGPWAVVAGNVLVALALVVVPVAAVRLRNRAVGAAAVAGALIVLASQFTSAVVQVDERVAPSLFGFTNAQVSQLGLLLTLKLTAWYTIDALAAFGLLVAVMAWATLREVQENSPGTLPSAPEARSEPISRVS